MLWRGGRRRPRPAAPPGRTHRTDAAPCRSRTPTMARISDAKRASCQANGRLSKGPISPRGRARSSKNAVKHGLSGRGISLLPEDQALLEHRVTCWSEELGAVGDLEHELVVAAAHASVRRRRIALTEAKNAGELMEKAWARAVRRA